jgi:Tol biopolymer transport system component
MPVRILKTMGRRRSLLALSIVCVSVVAVRTNGAGSAKAYDAATDAWRRGDYIAALNGYVQLLSGPDADEYLEPIALTTGELFETRELTPDGRAPRFSPDGRFIVYESGLETSRTTRVLANDASRARVADLPGVSAAFTRDGARVAYLRVVETDELRRVSQALESAPLTAQNRGNLTQTIARLIARDSTIVVRDLASGSETEMTAPAMLKSGLACAPDGRTLYFLGARTTDDARSDIYSIAAGESQPTRLTDIDGLKGPPLVDPSGEFIIYVPATANQNPFRRPEAGQASGAGGAGTAGGAGPTQRPPTFGIIDLKARKVSVVAGSAPALSADGKTLAYVTRAGSDYSLMIGPPLGTAVPVKHGPERLDAPAWSSDGSRIAFQSMPNDDWEILVVSRDGKNERRVTREIQHDLLPRFIGPDRLLAVIGEPRHRRSYLYDLGAPQDGDLTPKRTRLFHNNTVRTLAPEYQWSVSPDGTKVLIGAERDGNTVSPERGVYLVDLSAKVTKAEVLDRLRVNLKSESSLKATATRVFQPIAAEVRRLVSNASPSRVYAYEKALFDFDSKHISRPGNRRASEFLFNTYKSFGYSPEFQWFEPRGALDGKTANVVATLRGTTNPELVYIVSSHYDSVAAGAGADDDSSGTAALLEAARVLADHPQPATIVFASFTGEEAGLLGSREFVRRAVDGKMRVVGALNNDMIGWMNDERLDNTIRYSNPGIRDIQHAAASLFTRLTTFDALYFKGTDAVSLYDAYGDIVGGFGSYPVLGSPYYHQATDLLEHESHELITETSKATMATLMLMASSPSRITDLKVGGYSGTRAELTWTPSPEKSVASYIVAYGPVSEPLRHRLTVAQPRVTLQPIAPDTIVSVKAVNARGLEGWDWARVTVASSTPRGAVSTGGRPGIQ